jgi:ribosome-associated heat shock protein Hsp15
MSEAVKVRLDKYLWAIRLFKTRSQASAAIDAGKVKYNDGAVKASRIVGIGDIYQVKTEARKWVIEVTAILDTRVQYSEAIKYYKDNTPPELIEMQKSAFSFNSGKRMNKSGRPTKKDRRDLDDFL